MRAYWRKYLNFNTAVYTYIKWDHNLAETILSNNKSDFNLRILKTVLEPLYFM